MHYTIVLIILNENARIISNQAMGEIHISITLNHSLLIVYTLEC
jgi:hypothetical protein